MEQNINNPITNSPQNQYPNINVDPTKDIGGYAEDFLLRKRKLGLQIEEEEAKLVKAIKDRMENPAASDEAYSNLIKLMKSDIEILKFKRDNLHNEKTIH